MGYTHYWKLPNAEIEVDKWNSFVKDFKEILPNFVGLLDTKGDQKLQVDSETIYLNGIGEEQHETFSINRVGASDFEFCKTARKPYDIAVCSALIIAKRHFGDAIEVSSDGDNADSEWLVAKALCIKELGYGSLDMGDVYKTPEGDYKVRHPETQGQLLDLSVVEEAQKIREVENQ